MHGYGYVDDDTPEISLSLYPAYRNNGIGSQLLNSMLDLLKNNGVKKVSLSVSRTNRAVSLYKRFGFEIIDRDRDLTTAEALVTDNITVMKSVVLADFLGHPLHSFTSMNSKYLSYSFLNSVRSSALKV